MVQGVAAVWLPVDDMERAVGFYEELRAQGVDFAGGISEHPWGRIAAMHDPEGNSLQLYEPPA
jgi:predicted enzyme related to lactoylglutathione lyase